MDQSKTPASQLELLQRRQSANEHEVALLEQDPGALVTLYQGMIKAIVIHFVTSGMFRFAEIDDVMQTISLELLSKMPAIRRQYNGSVLLKTYVSSIARNVCLRMKQDRKGDDGAVPLEDETIAGPTHSDRRVLLQEAIERLRTILEMFDGQRPRLLLALKVHYRIPILCEEIAAWYPGSDERVRDALAGLFPATPADPKRIRIYDFVVPMINVLEKKDTSPDSFRRWTWEKIDEVIDLLNGGFRQSNFDRESLRELVEDYFTPFLLRE